MSFKIDKKKRQYIGLISAILSYYVIHEGAHLLYALITKTFKQINLVGILGVQVDIYRDRLTDFQLGIFCIVGSIATIVTSYVLVLFIDKIVISSSKVLKACLYYITLAMLFIDPIYLGLIYKISGGGDMNGISPIIPEFLAQCIYLAIFLFNIFIFLKIVLPKYKIAFLES